MSFEATHCIVWSPHKGGTEETIVMLEGEIAYTQEQWDESLPPEWELGEDGRWRFLDLLTPYGMRGTVHAIPVTFAS